MAMNLLIKQVIGQSFVIKPDGELKQIKINSKIASHDVITVAFGKNAWLVSRDQEQVDLLDNILLIKDSGLQTLNLPAHVIAQISQFIEDSNRCLQQDQPDKNRPSIIDIQHQITRALIRLGLQNEQAQALVNFRYEPFLAACQNEPIVTLSAIPIIRNISNYQGRVVATIQVRDKDSRHYQLSVKNDPNGYFFALKGNMLILTEEGANALNTNVFSLDEILATISIKMRDFQYDASIEIPFVENSQPNNEVEASHKLNTHIDDIEAPPTKPEITETSTNQITTSETLSAHEVISPESEPIDDVRQSAETKESMELIWEQNHSENSGNFSVSGVLPEPTFSRQLMPLSTMTARGEFVLHQQGRWSFFCDDPTGILARMDENTTFDEFITLTTNNGDTHHLKITVAKDSGEPKVLSVSLYHSDHQSENHYISGRCGLAPKLIEENAQEETTKYSGNYGTLSVSQNHQWEYHTDEKHALTLESLNDGETLTDSFILRNDEHEVVNLLITLRRLKNISLAYSLLSHKNGCYTIGDLPESFEALNTLFPQTHQGHWGTLTLNLQGQWLYALDPQHQRLSKSIDAEFCESFIINTGAHLERLSFNMHKIDNLIVFTEVDISPHDPQAKQLHLNGFSNFYLDDHQAIFFEDQMYSSNLGQLKTCRNGQWFYLTNTAHYHLFESLAPEIELSDLITLKHSETQSILMEISITGTNDQPVISSRLSFESYQAQTEALVQASGHITQFQQDDIVPIRFEDDIKEGLFGQLEIHKNQWIYTLDPSPKCSLKLGEIYTDTFILSTTEKNQYSLVISITGTQEDPVIFGNVTGELNSIKENTITGNTSIFNEQNAGTNFTIADISLDGKFGFLTLVDGEWKYTLSHTLLSYLPEGELRYDPFTLIASDQSTHHIFITITGTDDEPLLHAQTSSTSHDHASFPTLSGELKFNEDDQTCQINDGKHSGAYGSFVISDGHWHYSLDPEITEYLQINEVLTDLVAIKSVTGTVFDVEIEIRHSAKGIELHCIPAEHLISHSDQAMISGELTVELENLETTPKIIDVQCAAKYGKFTISDQHWTYRIDPELVSILENGMAVSDWVDLKDDQGGNHRLTIAARATKTGTQLSQQLSSKLKSVFNPDSKDDEIIFEKPELKAVQASPKTTSPQGNDEGFSEFSSIVVEKMNYPSVSGAIYLDKKHKNQIVNIEYVVCEGKYGTLSVLNAHWIYTFAPDKILPYCAETREFFIVTDTLGQQHEIIITIESGLKKPVITDVYLGKSPESQIKSKPSTHQDRPVR